MANALSIESCFSYICRGSPRIQETLLLILGWGFSGARSTLLLFLLPRLVWKNGFVPATLTEEESYFLLATIVKYYVQKKASELEYETEDFG